MLAFTDIYPTLHLESMILLCVHYDLIFLKEKDEKNRSLKQILYMLPPSQFLNLSMYLPARGSMYSTKSVPVFSKGQD